VVKEDLGSGFYKISVTIGNAGYLPTYISDRARIMKENKGLEVCISGYDEMVEGNEKVTIDDLSSFSKTNTDNYFYGNISTGNSDPVHKKISWIIRQEKEKEIAICVTGRKAGKAETTV
ncbi:MAG: hypothetical protein IKE38_04480, partial [Erysipelotrichaceae bacterium]|nr:hypothetical protein [Erysipelotrichaceae bacterium]